MLYVLIVLHGVSGHEITVNSKLITNMSSGKPGQKNQNVSEEVKCVINMADGKFISVIESCDKVRELIGRRE